MVGDLVTVVQVPTRGGVHVLLLGDRVPHQFGDHMVDELLPPLRLHARLLQLREHLLHFSVIVDDHIDQVLLLRDSRRVSLQPTGNVEPPVTRLRHGPNREHVQRPKPAVRPPTSCRLPRM